MKLTAVLFGVAFVSTVCAKPDDPQEVVTSPPVHSSSSTTIPLTAPTNPASPPQNTTASPTKTTTSPTSTSTPSTSTSTPAPSSTTSVPSSTTPDPSSTTPAPASTSTTPLPTSPSPQTTSTLAPSSPKPSPKPVPKEYYWNVTDDKGAICILAKADITLKLAYTNVTSSKLITEDIKILPNATSSGMCDENHQVLKLTLGNTSIAFNFQQNNDSDYHLSHISSNITLNEAIGNQSVISLASDDLKVFKTKLNTSYECRWSEPAVLKEIDEYLNFTKATLHVNMDNIRFEAFRQMQGHSFAKAYTCEMDNTDLVPIMVGIALGILVAVVLMAYLVGRRSTQAHGYLSM